jgi:hypothetical protein
MKEAFVYSYNMKPVNIQVSKYAVLDVFQVIGISNICTYLTVQYVHVYKYL